MSVPGSPRLIGPAFERATVADAMRVGIISCPPDARLREVAEIMASYRVHAVVVEGSHAQSSREPGRPWRIVSDSELVDAAARGELHQSAGELVGADAIFIEPSEPLQRAAELMNERGVSHLIVSATPTARPAGIISTLDLAVVIAWGRG